MTEMAESIVITFAASALTDIHELREWYAEQQVPEVGRRLSGEIVAKVESLQMHPDMGRVVPEFGVAALRELIHPPFRIVYRREPGKVRIVRIWRSERLLKLP